VQGQWELILDGALEGAVNMAIDAELLAEVEATPSPRTILRFYTWIRPTLSLGRNQKVEKAADPDFCLANGIDIVHRPTGGRAVLHDDELTYAVISNDAATFGETIYGNYKRVSQALCIGFNRLGVPAILAPDTCKPNSCEKDTDPPCFVSPSRYELMVDGRKIAGSAQRRVRRSFLQHGSMPITVNREALGRATRMHDIRPLDTEMAGCAEFLPVRPTLQQLTGAFMGAFQDYFEIDFRPKADGAIDTGSADCYKSPDVAKR
jgi:lipoate-protein ligase A